MNTHFLESSPIARRHIVWDLIDIKSEGETLIEVSDEVRNNLLKKIGSDELHESVRDLDVNDIDDILQSPPESLIMKP